MALLLLQSQDNFGDFLTYDTGSHEQTYVHRDDDELEDVRPDGLFAEVEETLLMFYRQDGDLFFQVEQERININNTVFSILDRGKTDTLFILMQGDHVLLRFTYDHNALDGLIAGDDTAFADEEDFDFCLLVHNVISDEGRRKRIFRN